MPPLRVGLLGAGFQAEAHCRAYARCTRPPAVVVGVASRSRRRAEDLARRFGIGRVYGSPEELCAHVEIDAVDVCTPNGSHAPLARMALEAGKHIMVEKPLTGYFGPPDAPASWVATGTSRRAMFDEAMRAADDILALARRRGLLIGYAENLVYSPAVERLQQLLTQSQGTILEIRANESHSGSHAEYARRWREAGGGALLRLGAHPIGLALYLKRWEGTERTGTPIEVAAVSAEVATLHGGADPAYLAGGWVDVENWSACTITFTDGSRAVCLASDLALGGMENAIHVLTDRARLNIDLGHHSLLQVYAPSPSIFPGEPFQEKSHTNAGWSYPPVNAEWIYGLEHELQDFVAAFSEGRATKSDGVLGRATLEAIYAGYLSAEQGRRVVLRGKESHRAR